MYLLEDSNTRYLLCEKKISYVVEGRAGSLQLLCGGLHLVSQGNDCDHTLQAIVFS